ncbi:MAG: ABC transporter ATP-binding protein [Actinomycetota bacterium]|nr:ABC transporter ATP-binding protein [Actinomycetota bacterium]
MSAISCTQLSKSYGAVRAVDGLALEVEAGSLTALLGPSGCGKTTTLRLLAGFERPDQGAIRAGDRLLAGDGAFVPPEERRIGVVFQEYALFPHHDVAGNIAYALGRRPEMGRVSEVLALVGLDDVSDRPVHELSGGQQQRVALARALAPSPDVVLLDEPFSNLDASLRDRLRQEVSEILRETGVTAIFVTHDQEEALSVADTVAVMNEGRIEQIGSPEEVYSRPASRWVAEFVGETEVLEGRVRDGRAECELGSIPAGSAQGGVDILIRPESLAVTVQASSRSVPAEVVSRRFFGHDQMLELRLGSGRVVRSRQLGFPTWHPGDRVHVRIAGPADVNPHAENGSGAS